LATKLHEIERGPAAMGNIITVVAAAAAVGARITAVLPNVLAFTLPKVWRSHSRRRSPAMTMGYKMPPRARERGVPPSVGVERMGYGGTLNATPRPRAATLPTRVTGSRSDTGHSAIQFSLRCGCGVMHFSGDVFLHAGLNIC